ncbi:hypothetical protein JOC27_001299 [Sporolactobacillus spathodeae]|uniref:Uncharacterized protein n=1 Tax=Sporolactobacillus spathodeae TaxID=1465502 RepID=A0ABS2Q9J9_9BACL|nr:hypothetical protein [Sporolactobacillus spathodeae]
MSLAVPNAVRLLTCRGRAASLLRLAMDLRGLAGPPIINVKKSAMPSPDLYQMLQHNRIFCAYL